MICSHAGYVDVFIPIIVIVGGRHADAVHFYRESCLPRDIREACRLDYYDRAREKFWGFFARARLMN